MAIQLLTSKIAVGVIGNRAIVSGFTSLPVFSPNPTLGPGFTNTKGFSILYSEQDPMHDKLMSFGTIPTTTGGFPGFAYGPITWDLENLALHCEMRDEEIEGDPAVPGPYFPPDVLSNPPPMYGRATYLIGASLGFMALSQLGQIYPAGWNLNIALNTHTGDVYWFDPWVISPGYLWLNTMQDCNPPLLPKFVFTVDAGNGVTKLMILDVRRIYIYAPTGAVNGFGRKVYDLEAFYDTPGDNYVATRIGTRFIGGITNNKIVWIFDVNQQIYWLLSYLPWPDVDVYDNFTASNVKICYDERRGRLIAHQPRSVVPNTNPVQYIGNNLVLYALVPVPKYINDPVPLDTLRVKKKSFWVAKVIGDHGELISNKRATAGIDDPVIGRLLTTQGATNARGQMGFGYGGPDENTDVGSSSITVRTNDGPGIT